MSAESNVVDFPDLDFDRDPADRRTVIEVCKGELPRLINQAEAALHEARAGIYQRGGMLVRIVRLDRATTTHGVKRDAGSVLIHPVSREYLVVALARAARWVKYDGRTRAVLPMDPPPVVAGGLLSLVGEWTFPQLQGLVAAPTLRPDGSLLDAPGYDVASGLYAAFERGQFPAIDPKPPRTAALEALALLDELFSECTFSGGPRSPHASVAIAASITACVRHALSMAPAFATSARKQGSGKTTTAKVPGQLATGRDPPVIAPTDDENELKKALLAILIAGDSVVLIDNVARPVDSAALCAVLTSASYSDRVLGVSQKVTVPTASTWLLTGNGIEFVGDLTSRVLLSVLDPEVEHPEARPFKRDLADYVLEHRGELIRAALTIPLAYIAAGSPPVDAPRSRFSDWDAYVRRPLLWVGAADPLETQAELRASDPVRESLIAVLQAWDAWQTWRLPDAAADPKGSASVAEAIKAATALGQGTVPQQQQLREALAAVAGERDGSLNARRLGRYLTRNLRRIEDGKRLEDAGADPVSKTRRFKVAGVSMVSGVTASPTREIAILSGMGGANTDKTGNTVRHTNGERR